MTTDYNLASSFTSLTDMDRKEKLEEELRVSACLGDVNRVEELINLGVDINSRHPRNGRTALIFACQMSRQDVVTLLLQNGADQNIISDNGESPKTVCTNPQILQQLITSSTGLTRISSQKAYNSLHQGPLLDYNVDQIYSKVTNSSEGCVNSSSNQLVLKVRLANAPDPDFIEIDLPKAALTYQVLLQVCCQELEVDESRVIKLRKLPNTKIRRDKDVERLENLQEIELVTEASLSGVHSQSSNGAAIPLTATNNYLSISKKDQTILY